MVAASTPSPVETAGAPQGLVVLPAFADPHVHLDKALTSDLVRNPRGDLRGAIEAWIAFRATQGVEDVHRRARQAALELLAHGATAIRAHIDTGPDIGLTAIAAALRLRDELADVLPIQVVACAGLPLSGVAGAPARTLASEALELGADLLGGAPYLDEHPAEAYDALIAIALEAGTGLDLHVDETLDPDVFTLPDLLDRVATGFPHPVAVGHIVSLLVQDRDVRRRTIARLAASGVAVVTLPATNLFLQGRGGGTPVARGITAVHELLDAGVTVGAGVDNVRDPFNPTGRFDPLETASLLVTAAHLTSEQALAAVTSGPRALMGLAGEAAGTVTLPGSSIAEVIAAGPATREVRRGEQLIARSHLDTWTAA